MFKISDKVVCVDASKRGSKASLWRPELPRPKEGVVYVVRDSWADNEASEGWLIQLVGFPDVIHPTKNRPMGWTPSRFRKLDEIKAENRATVQAGNRHD